MIRTADGSPPRSRSCRRSGSRCPASARSAPPRWSPRRRLPESAARGSPDLPRQGTIVQLARSTRTSAATLSAPVTEGSDPRARVAYTSAATASTAQPASWRRPSAPNEDIAGEMWPYAEKAITSAEATIAPRRRPRSRSEHTASAIAAPRIARPSGASASTGRTSLRFAAYRNNTAYAANSIGWSGIRPRIFMALMTRRAGDAARPGPLPRGAHLQRRPQARASQVHPSASGPLLPRAVLGDASPDADAGDDGKPPDTVGWPTPASMDRVGPGPGAMTASSPNSRTTASRLPPNPLDEDLIGRHVPPT